MPLSPHLLPLQLLLRRLRNSPPIPLIIFAVLCALLFAYQLSFTSPSEIYTSSHTHAPHGSLYRKDECLHDKELPWNAKVAQLLTPPETVRVWSPHEYNMTRAIEYMLRYWLEDQEKHGKLITSQLIRSGLGGHECVLIQVINEEVYVFSTTWEKYVEEKKNFLTVRRFQAVQLLVDVVAHFRATRPAHVKFPDLELLHCTGDCLEDPAAPTFVQVVSHKERNLPWPFFDRGGFLPDWNKTYSKARSRWETVRKTTWHKRNNQAIFRGGRRVCHVLADEEGNGPQSLHEHWERPGWTCGRDRLVEVARTCHNERFDVTVDSSYSRGLFGYFLQRDMIPMEEQEEQYKYLIYAEGQCQWAERMRRTLMMDILLVKQLNIVHEFYDLPHEVANNIPNAYGFTSNHVHEHIGMLPWVHYVPVDHLFNNLPEVIEWCITHDAEVQTIIDNMHKYAQKLFAPDQLFEFIIQYFSKYATLLEKPIRKHPEAAHFLSFVRGSKYIEGVSPKTKEIVLDKVTKNH